MSGLGTVCVGCRETEWVKFGGCRMGVVVVLVCYKEGGNARWVGEVGLFALLRTVTTFTASKLIYR